MNFAGIYLLIRGGGDLATGAIYRLHRAGFPLVVLELAQPLVVRRGVAVATAVLQGEVVIEGMVARHVASPEEALALADAGIVPVLVSPDLPSFPRPIAALIDARMAKRPLDTRIDQAPLVIALGPGFTAGVDCHAVVETMRGHSLGRAIWQGTAQPDTGTPGLVAGKGAERVLRAPAAGIVQWQVAIGQKVQASQALGEVAGSPVVAPFAGVLRGLIAPGTRVPVGLKIGDLDPRGDVSACFTISDKALAVGGGVVEAVLAGLGPRLQVPAPRLSLPAALGLGAQGEIVALVGGGGKTTTLFALAQALGPGVVTTTTTRIFAAQMRQAPAVCPAGNLAELGQVLRRYGTCLVVGESEGEKVHGVPASLPAALLARPDVRHVLVEADGSRMRPCKAPAEHEPVIPAEATTVVVVAGLDALEKPIAGVAHRPERVCQITGLRPEQTLTAQALARLLGHPQGGLKGAPPGARLVVLLNKVEVPARLPAARQVARLLLQEPRVNRVVLGAVQTSRPVREIHRRVWAVVLAAGQSRRMGRPKQLLPWGDSTILGQTLRHVRQSQVDGILLVTGHRAREVAAIAQAEGVATVHNPDYAAGEMLSSLQTAVRRLPAAAEAILVVLADQPMVEPATLDRLLEAYWQGHGGLVAPTFDGRRGNPVLIDRAYFPELLALPAAGAPRDLLAAHRDELVLLPVETDAVLRDLDSPEDVARWQPEPGGHDAGN